MPRSFRSHAGFTLVELSIVLVILGLLAGGILAGQSLIRAAELRNVVTEYQDCLMAVRVFREKYRALPGDMPDATALWGRADNGTFSGQCASPATNKGSGTQTCNGNGDGYIEQSYQQNNETFRFWQHLSNAGLLPGKYTGMRGPDNRYHHVPGENAPASKISGAGWSVNNEAQDFQQDYERFWNRKGQEWNGLFIGMMNPGYEPSESAFSPDEVWNIDQKIDDGTPGNGIVQAMQWATCTTATTSTGYENARYKLQASGHQCAIHFYQAFAN